MNLRTAVLCLLFVLARTDASAQPQPDPWFRQSAAPKDFVPARLPWDTFTIDLPKGWQIVPAYGGGLVTVTEKTRNNVPRAAIMLEQMKLVEPLSASDVDGILSDLEVTLARQRDPAGQNFQAQVKESGPRRFVFIQYSRPGLYGEERLTQYSVPAGRVMYRLMCISPATDQTAKYQTTCAHVAASFTPITQGAP